MTAEHIAVWGVFRSSPTARLGLFLILTMIALAVLAPVLAPYDPLAADLRMRNAGLSAAHWLGTDELGRDILSRIVYGARISLFAAATAVALALAGGLALGLASGYAGRWVDMVVMRLVDVLLSFPAFLLALVIAAILGSGLLNAVVAVAVARLPQFARLTRGSVLVSKELEYVHAAAACGCGAWRIAFRHILPNIAGPVIVQATLVIATSILTITGLGFLGIGIDPQTPEWGAMLGSGFKYMRIAPHVAVVPGIFIMLAVLGFNWVGDGLRDALDPRMRRFVGGVQT